MRRSLWSYIVVQKQKILNPSHASPPSAVCLPITLFNLTHISSVTCSIALETRHMELNNYTAEQCLIPDLRKKGCKYYLQRANFLNIYFQYSMRYLESYWTSNFALSITSYKFSSWASCPHQLNHFCPPGCVFFFLSRSPRGCWCKTWVFSLNPRFMCLISLSALSGQHLCVSWIGWRGRRVFCKMPWDILVIKK